MALLVHSITRNPRGRQAVRWVKARLSAVLRPPKQSNLTSLQPMSTNGLVFPPVFLSAITSPGGSAYTQRDVLSVAHKIMDYLKLLNRSKFYSFEELQGRYNYDFKDDIKAGRFKALDQELFRSVVDYLHHRKSIEVNGSGGVRYYNQEMAIKDLSGRLSKLIGSKNLHELVETVAEHAKGLFRNFDLYLRNGSTGEMLIVSGSREGSTYEEWVPMEEGGVFHEMLSNRADQFLYFDDIETAAKAEGPIFPHNVERYVERFGEDNVGEAFYSVVPINDQGDALAIKVTEWDPAAKANNRPFYSENVGNDRSLRNVVNSAIHSLLVTLAARASFVIDNNSEAGLKQVWKIEEREASQSLEAEPALAAAHPIINHPVPAGFDLFTFLTESTVPRDHLRYSVASIFGPSKLAKGLQRGIVEALDWESRGYDDMLRHSIDVDETRIAFWQGLPVAFASINALNFVYTTHRGKKIESSIIPLVGTLVRDEHQRGGLQVLLNHELLLKKWLRQKFSRDMFKPLRIAVRTRNPVVIHALYTHFKGVRFKNLTQEQGAARERYAQHLRCEVDDLGIVRNAYDKVLPEKEKYDFKRKPKIGRKIRQAMSGLGSKDARLFVFKYGLLQIVKTRLWLWWKKIRFKRKLRKRQA